MRLDSSYALFPSNLGYTLQEQERYEEARDAFSLAVEADSSDGWNWYARGFMNYFMSNDVEAIADMEQA